MHLQRRHDMDHDLVLRPDVVDLQLLVHLLMDHLNDKDLKTVRHLYVVGNYRDRPCLPDVVCLVVLQNQDVLNQDVVLTFQDVHQLHLLVVVADAEQRHLLKMDCYQDAEDVEHLVFHLPLKMDCCQVVVPQAFLLLFPIYLQLLVVALLVLFPRLEVLSTPLV